MGRSASPPRSTLGPKNRPPLHGSVPVALRPTSDAGGAAEAAPTLPHPSPPITGARTKPIHMGTLLNSVQLEMPLPERNDGMERVNAAPQDPHPKARDTAQLHGRDRNLGPPTPPPRPPTERLESTGVVYEGKLVVGLWSLWEGGGRGEGAGFPQIHRRVGGGAAACGKPSGGGAKGAATARSLGQANPLRGERRLQWPI